MISAATFIKSPIVKKIVNEAVKVGYSQLLKRDSCYALLAKYGIVKPEDDTRKLYFHAMVLFAALGKPSEYIDLLMLKSVSEAFKAEKVHNEIGAFARQLDAELHTNSLVRKIKDWDKLPEGDVDHFLMIYDRLVKDNAPASSVALLNGQEDLKQGMGTLLSGQSSMEQNILSAIKDLGAGSSNDVLLKEYETQINELSEELASGHASLILEKFVKLKSRVWDQLDNNLKFRLMTNIGVCYYQLNDSSQSAAVLIEAYHLLPGSEVAMSNLVNAHMAVDDHQSALEYLAVFLNKFPASVNAHACRIKINVNQQSVTVLESETPKALLQHPEIIAALGTVAHKRNEFDLAIAYFQKALVLIPEDVFTLKHLLQSYLEKYATNFRILNLKMLDEDSEVELDKLLALVYKLLEKEKKSDNKKDLVHLHLAEGFVLSLQRRLVEAHAALDRGLFIDPSNCNVLKQKAFAYAFNGEFELTVKTLLKIRDYALMPDVPTLLAEAYRNAGHPEKGIKVLEDFIASKKPSGPLGDSYRRNAVHILLDMYLMTSRRSKIITLRKTRFKDGTLLDHLSLSRIAYFLEEADKGAEELLLAYGLVNGKSTFQERFFLAIDLNNRGFVPQAINLLMSIVDPKVYSEPARILYTLLWTQGQSKQSLEILLAIRNANGILEKPARFEMECYQQLADYPSACMVAKLYLEKFPENDEVRLALGGFYNRLGLQSKHLELLETPIAYLELSPEFFQTYLAQLSSLGKREQAVASVYEYQRIKDSLDATNIYQQVILMYPVERGSWRYPQKVEVNSVVGLKKGASEFFLILEERATLDLRKNEINPAQPSFQQLIGKCVGEQVTLDNGEVWMVNSIVSKYQYAFERTTDDLKTVYAGKGKFHYFSFEEEKAKLDARPELLEANRKAAREGFNATFGKYNNREISLWSLAKLYHQNVIAMRDQVMANPDVGFQCNDGIPLSVQEIHSTLAGRRLCADLSALLAIFELNLFEVVCKRFGKILITPSTIDVIMDAIEENTLFKKNPSADTPILKFKQCLDEYCEEVFPQGLLELNAMEKSKADRLTGKDVLDSYLLVLQTNGCYLSDDFVNRKSFQEIYKGAALWSGEVLRYIHTLGDISDEQLCLCNISLVWKKYQIVGMDAKILLTAFRHFRHSHPEKLLACLQILSDRRTTEESGLVVAFYYMLLGYRDEGLSEEEKVLLCDEALAVFLRNRDVRLSLERLTELLDSGYATKIGIEDHIHVPAIKARLVALIVKLKNDKLL